MKRFWGQVWYYLNMYSSRHTARISANPDLLLCLLLGSLHVQWTRINAGAVDTLNSGKGGDGGASYGFHNLFFFY